jgi:hypothetical protein
LGCLLSWPVACPHLDKACEAMEAVFVLYITYPLIISLCLLLSGLQCNPLDKKIKRKYYYKKNEQKQPETEQVMFKNEHN